jgi:hypothetical protein
MVILSVFEVFFGFIEVIYGVFRYFEVFYSVFQVFYICLMVSNFLSFFYIYIKILILKKN